MSALTLYDSDMPDAENNLVYTSKKCHLTRGGRGVVIDWSVDDSLPHVSPPSPTLL